MYVESRCLRLIDWYGDNLRSAAAAAIRENRIIESIAQDVRTLFTPEMNFTLYVDSTLKS